MDRSNNFWFVYYRNVNLISIDEITNGLVWKRVPELPHGFLTREDALGWLELLADDKLVEIPQRTTTWSGSRYSYKKPEEPIYRFAKFPAYFYKVFPAGIIYTEVSAPDTNSPWNVGVLREMVGHPRPESIHPPRRSKLRIAIDSPLASCGGGIVEI